MLLWGGGHIHVAMPLPSLPPLFSLTFTAYEVGLTDKVLLSVANTQVSFNHLMALTNGLGFDFVAIDNKLKSSSNAEDVKGVVLDLLHEWVMKHGKGIKQATNLYIIFREKVKHIPAAIEIQKGKQT